MREWKRGFESPSRWITLRCDICSSRARSGDVVYIMGLAIQSVRTKSILGVWEQS
jgi:hypothetical protein